MAQSVCLQHTVEAGYATRPIRVLVFVPHRRRRTSAALAASLGLDVEVH